MYIVVSHSKHVAELQIPGATLDFLLNSMALLLLPFILIKLLSSSILSYSMLPHLETHHLLRLYYNNTSVNALVFLSEYSYEVYCTIWVPVIVLYLYCTLYQ